MGAIGGDELSSWERRQDDGGASIGGYGGGKEERILVSVRLRPLNEMELMNKDPCDWECINENTVISRNNLPERSIYPTTYTFDRVFGCDCTTRRVYEAAAKEVALSVVSGINSSIFAYGQTSSGKTYTMTGITEYSVSDIYDYIQLHQERAFVLRFSAMEIYNEAVRDLLSTDNSPLRLLDDPERGTVVEKLSEETLRDRNHLKELISICEAQRQIGETSLNETSSRSHQILRLSIESSVRQFMGKGNSSTLSATVNFVDLAGSERASQAMSAGTRLKEGCHINRSLLTLGTVIRKLSKGRNGHIPYRDSKLTRILQPSLGGNARTAIICTMSPARSFIEQSRNTLLFASCAKEVTTNAHVNVVMSDKALVKHLQKELARLESELRYPGSPGVFHAEALLKEKDIQIITMEKEIKELMQQRDFAKSRLEDFLQSVGNNPVSRHWEINDTPVSYAMNACEDKNSLSEYSSVSYPALDFSLTKSSRTPDSADYSDISSEPALRNFEKQSRKQATSPPLSINSFDFEGLLQNQGEIEDKTQRSSEEVEDLCKEVRCIEMDETSMSTGDAVMTGSNSSLLVPMAEASSNYVDRKPLPNLEEDEYSNDYVAEVQEDKYSNIYVPEVREDKYPNNHVSEVTVCTLEEQLQIAKKASANLVKRNFEQPSPWSSDSRSSVLSRSTSCRPSISHSSPSPWFVVEEENESTPPSRLFRDFPGRPEGISRRVRTLNYSGGNAMLGEESKSESRSSVDVLGGNRPKSSSGEDISSLCDFVMGMKEMAQIQYQKHHDEQEGEERGSEDFGTDKAAKDVSMGPMLNPVDCPSRWSSEFEKQQQMIITLWHECNVSLVHRTYFFLLFKGDPADSIYMEVELRRLSYLKQTFNRGDAGKSMTEDGCIITPASSLRDLHREREALPRKMRKTLSSEERESLYQEWGIALDSKQRRLQLAHLLWSQTDDMNHIRESASIVAKLIGFLEKGRVLREMFGFSFFTPQRTNRRSYSWRQ